MFEHMPVDSPDCPEELSPQAPTVPSLLLATVWNWPAAMLVIWSRGEPATAPDCSTCTGMPPLGDVLLFPNWPKVLPPQAQTVLSRLIATPCCEPAATALTSLSALIRIG